MRTRTVLRMGRDVPIYLVDHVVEHDGDVRRWNRFTYHSPTSSSRHTGARDADGTVSVDGTSAPALFSAVGGYGEHLVLAQMLVDREDAVSYLPFDESDPVRRRGRREVGLVRSAISWSTICTPWAPASTRK